MQPVLRGMMSGEQRWSAALAEHESVLRDFLDRAGQVDPSSWQQPSEAGKWSHAALVLHVCRSYEMGRDAMRGAPSMRLRVPALQAWLSRIVLLPVLLATRRFPRGAEAPPEVVPDPAEARRLTIAEGRLRLERAAGEAVTALREAAGTRPVPQVTHAYFGALSPYWTLRLLTAHTRHHIVGLERLTENRNGLA
jgi:hypothetical protein